MTTSRYQVSTPASVPPPGTRRTKGRKADRDLAEQLQAVRTFASRAHVMQTAAPASSENDSRPVVAGLETTRSEVTNSNLPTGELFSLPEMEECLSRARRHPQEARNVLLDALQSAATAGPTRVLGQPGSADAFRALAQEFPHFGDVLTFVRNRALLAGCVAHGGFRLPPILLDGPPGVGKSAFAERLAAWMCVPITRIDMAQLDAAFKITGLDSGYSTGKPGLIWESLQSPCMSPVVVLDEIDKTRTLDGSGEAQFLLGLLEPLTASRFKDECVGLAVDASHIQWIATSNDAARLDPALLSRFRVFSVDRPADSHQAQVVRSVYRGLRQGEPWACSFPEQLDEEVVTALLGRSAREVRQALEDACANAVAAGRRTLRASDVPALRSRRAPQIGFLAAEIS